MFASQQHLINFNEANRNSGATEQLATIDTKCGRNVHISILYCVLFVDRSEQMLADALVNICGFSFCSLHTKTITWIYLYFGRCLIATYIQYFRSCIFCFLSLEYIVGTQSTHWWCCNVTFSIASIHYSQSTAQIKILLLVKPGAHIHWSKANQRQKNGNSKKKKMYNQNRM